MYVKLRDFKDMLTFLSNKYEVSQDWLIRNGVYLLYMTCDGLKKHIIDVEGCLLCEEEAFKGINKFIDGE